MSDLEKYKELCDEILKINDHIRYVGIFDKKLFVSKQREGLKNLLTEDETKESFSNTISMWEFRKQLATKLGNGIYSMTVYSKIIRLSIPFHKECLLLVSIDTIESHPEIVAKILKFKASYF